MSTRNGAHENPARGAERSEAQPESIEENPQRQWLTSAAWVAAIMLVLVAAGVATNGCGQQAEPHGQGMSSETHAEAAVAEPAGGAPVVAALQPATQAQKPAGTVEALPPDIVVTVPDTLVQPGQAIEITARGTDDVAEVVLWDGYGDHQGLVLDPNSNLWRVMYRVPLKPTLERLGVSLTAKNDAGRWRRVWVFLRIGEEPAAESLAPSPADTTAAD